MNLDLFLKANEIGVRLEITAGTYTWETQPLLLHQETIDIIRQTIKPLSKEQPCEYKHYADVYITFPDGSLKRPDISVFCKRPTEMDSAITLLPEAVIEIISEGYEAKDLELNPTFYLSQNVKDVVVLDPKTGFILHARKDGRKRFTSPTHFKLECGCEVTV